MPDVINPAFVRLEPAEVVDGNLDFHVFIRREPVGMLLHDPVRRFGYARRRAARVGGRPFARVVGKRECGAGPDR